MALYGTVPPFWDPGIIIFHHQDSNFCSAWKYDSMDPYRESVFLQWPTTRRESWWLGGHPQMLGESLSARWVRQMFQFWVLWWCQKQLDHQCIFDIPIWSYLFCLYLHAYCHSVPLCSHVSHSNNIFKHTLFVAQASASVFNSPCFLISSLFLHLYLLNGHEIHI